MCIQLIENNLTQAHTREAKLNCVEFSFVLPLWFFNCHRRRQLTMTKDYLLTCLTVQQNKSLPLLFYYDTRSRLICDTSIRLKPRKTKDG